MVVWPSLEPASVIVRVPSIGPSISESVVVLFASSTVRVGTLVASPIGLRRIFTSLLTELSVLSSTLTSLRKCHGLCSFPSLRPPPDCVDGGSHFLALVYLHDPCLPPSLSTGAVTLAYIMALPLQGRVCSSRSLFPSPLLSLPPRHPSHWFASSLCISSNRPCNLSPGIALSGGLQSRVRHPLPMPVAPPPSQPSPKRTGEIQRRVAVALAREGVGRMGTGASIPHMRAQNCKDREPTPGPLQVS
jgi:hypothetical protein